MPFNSKQQEALDLSINEDALIAAAAGSGKTRVLSERVYNLINEGKLKPSELLVLTFTNNAAYEMKSRIIDIFDNNGKKDLALEMKSSHIQTFDSFSQYLVTKYSGYLGIADTISIIDETIIDLKRKIFLDEVIDEYYNNDFDRIVGIFKRFSSLNDSSVKDIILDIDTKLSKMTDEKRNRILNSYNDIYLSKEKFNEIFDKYISYYKDIIINALYEYSIIDNNYDIDSLDIEELKDIISNPDNFNKDYRKLKFTYECTNDVYKKLLKLLDMNSSDFVSAVKNAQFDTDYKSITGKDDSISGSKEEIKYYRKIHNKLCNLVQKSGNALPKLLDIVKLDSEESLYQKYYKMKDAIELFFEIVKKVDSKIDDYKKSTNCYTFLDISKLTNRLISDSKYSDIQDEIRSQFKYIMVDEYQDSNDFQEMMLDSLMKVNKKGKRAHLFCVGDVKQSIYAFRNSNVELFRGRQERYRNSSDPNEKVIDMNFNYRSGKPLLHDINYLFERYMTLDNGAIDYSKEEEKLHYDDEANLFGKEYNEFGVHRIIKPGPTTKEWEAYAILSDIKNKIESGFLVYDKGKGTRKCTYSDFAIITRKKSGFLMYQKLFYEYGIPINNKIPEILTDVDAIITLQSLFTLIDARLNYIKDTDIEHLFISLARSYIYEYDDSLIDSLIRNKKIYDDKIMIDIDSFVKEHRDSEFDTIFLDALVKFKVIEKLHLIGNVSDNISKIESLYSLVLNEKNAGEGISDFVNLFKTITKNKFELKDEANISLENAVDMMTIHASKGLERKIVYLPASYNIHTFGGRSSLDYEFNEDLGLILNDYDIKEDGSPYDVKTLLSRVNGLYNENKKIDTDEFVRLLYVALTRAENICYIVGEYKGASKRMDQTGRLSLSDIYKSLPSYYYTDNSYLEKMCEKGIITIDDIKAYYHSIDYIRNIKTSPIPNLDKNQTKVYNSFYYSRYYDSVVNNHTNIIMEISEKLYHHYKEIVENDIDNIDLLARLYSIYYGIPNINTFSDYYSYLLKKQESNDDNEDDEDSDYSHLEKITEDNLKEDLKLFGNILITEDVEKIGIKLISDKDESKRRVILGILPLYVEAFDNIKDYMVKSYSLDGFNDKKIYPDFSNLEVEKEGEPSLPKVEIFDKEISFKERVKFRASINPPKDNDSDIGSNLEYGIYLHHLLELLDFSNIDTSYITDQKAKGYIDSALKLPVFSNLKGAKVYKEYGYYDDDYDTTGFIDLLYVKDGIYYIIDYKSSDISKPGYVSQLHTYQRNVMRLFNVDRSKIKLYLVSILNSKEKEIEVE